VRSLAVCSLAIAACSFSTKLTPSDDAPVDAMPDAPPPSPLVKFTTITSTTTAIRPGLYGIELSATLRNELDVPITDLAVTLTFASGATDRAGDFRWRDFDARENVMTLQPQMVAPNGEATYRFKIDALPWAIPPGPITINGAATFLAGATPLSASPSETPLALPFSAFGTIIVNSLVDEADADTQICFREAMTLASQQAGVDRIAFDPTVFPPGAPAVSVFSAALPQIVVNHEVVIDGHGAGVILAVDASSENNDRYALRIAGGNVVVGGITFRNFGYSYQNQGDLSGDNCGGNPPTMFDGSAIRIDNGQLTLDGNTFEDPDVGERNCVAASVRLQGGMRHRILNNTWTNQSMDALYVDASTLEISGNVMNAGNNTAKVDECIFIAGQGGAPLWITNNICVDQEYSGVIAGGTDAGGLFVVNNTFVRNGLTGLSAVRRSGNRAITLRNNVYIGNNPSAILLDNNGTGFNVAYEAHTNNPLFSGTSTNATISNIINPGNAGLTDAGGATRAAMTPLGNSPLVGSGVDFLDVNGVTPNHFNGSGPERGAVELP
jgi:hypothetical protein